MKWWRRLPFDGLARNLSVDKEETRRRGSLVGRDEGKGKDYVFGANKIRNNLDFYQGL